ncbi:MAG: glycoside hydrolase family 105 protein [Salinibacter sp.]
MLVLLLSATVEASAQPDQSFSPMLDTAAVHDVAEAVAEWQLRYPGRYAVWGRTASGDSVALVLHGDGTIVRRAVRDWERPPPSRAADAVPEGWAAFVREKTQPDFGYADLPAPVRETVERAVPGSGEAALQAHSVFAPRGWVMGALYAGLAAWGRTVDSTPVLSALRQFGQAAQWRLGDRVYVADDHAVGQMYLALYERSKKPARLRNVQMQFDWILDHPPGQAMTWKAGINRWTWADALFMSPPVWAHLAALTGEERYREYMNEEWWATTEHLYDEEAHLFYRDDRFIERRGPHGENIFWSRGNGWVLAGLVRVLEHLPADHPDRDRYERLYREMTRRVIALQADDGLWRSNLLDPAGTSDPEVSGSGFFCYALAWGLNRDLLTSEAARTAVGRAWKGLVGVVQPNGRLTRVQPPGDRPAPVPKVETAPYGVGAFLLAAYRLAWSASH